MGYDDYIEFALDCAEIGDVLLRFPNKVGSHARFGYHHGQWTLVTVGQDRIEATSFERAEMFDVLAEDLTEVEVIPASKDRPWKWFLNKPQDGKWAMFESHCMCGQFRCSNDHNSVYRWREAHDNNCDIGSKPSIITPDEDHD
jgi:hypothetical protein